MRIIFCELISTRSLIHTLTSYIAEAQFLINQLALSGQFSTAYSSSSRPLSWLPLSLASPRSFSTVSSLCWAKNLVWVPSAWCRCCTFSAYLFLSDVYSINFLYSIGAAILSHRVDTFTLVSAFFLFSLGCLNCLLGLIFRAGAKAKRSVTSWRDHAKASLPTHIGPINVQPAVNSVFSPSGSPSFISNLYTGTNSGSHGSDEKSNMSSLGFGRQGEKAAALKGYLISKPIETLPRYAAKPESF